MLCLSVWQIWQKSVWIRETILIEWSEDSLTTKKLFNCGGHKSRIYRQSLTKHRIEMDKGSVLLCPDATALFCWYKVSWCSMIFHYVSRCFMASKCFKWRANFHSQERCPKDSTGSRARNVVTFMCTSWRAQKYRTGTVQCTQCRVQSQCRVDRNAEFWNRWFSPWNMFETCSKHVRNISTCWNTLKTAYTQVLKLSRFTRISAVHSVARLIFRISVVLSVLSSITRVVCQFTSPLPGAMMCHECSVNKAVDLTQRKQKNTLLYDYIYYGQHVSKLLKHTMVLDPWFLKMSAAKLQGLPPVRSKQSRHF